MIFSLTGNSVLPILFYRKARSWYWRVGALGKRVDTDTGPLFQHQLIPLFQCRIAAPMMEEGGERN